MSRCSPARLIGWSLVQGALAFGLVAAIFVVALDRGMPEDEVRALAFFSLVLAIVGLIFVNRSFSSSVHHRDRSGRTGHSVVVLIAVPALLGLTLPGRSRQDCSPSGRCTATIGSDVRRRRSC